jgi:hypothetical protein
MKCRKAEQWILARREAPLAPGHELRLQQHLAACRSCAGYAGDQSSIDRLLVNAPLAEPSESFEWRLRLAISKAEREALVTAATPAWPRFGRTSLQFGGAALAAGLAVLIGGTWLMPDSRPVSSPSAMSSGSLTVSPNRDGQVTPLSDGAPIGPRPGPSYSYFIQSPPPATSQDSSLTGAAAPEH